MKRKIFEKFKSSGNLNVLLEMSDRFKTILSLAKSGILIKSKSELVKALGHKEYYMEITMRKAEKCDLIKRLKNSNGKRIYHITMDGFKFLSCYK